MSSNAMYESTICDYFRLVFCRCFLLVLVRTWSDVALNWTGPVEMAYMFSCTFITVAYNFHCVVWQWVVSTVVSAETWHDVDSCEMWLKCYCVNRREWRHSNSNDCELETSAVTTVDSITCVCCHPFMYLVTTVLWKCFSDTQSMMHINPSKCNGVRYLHLTVFNATQA